MTVWILTTEYNDYDQHGSYFVDVFMAKPTADQLKASGVPDNRVVSVLSNEGRVLFDYQWYNLEEVTVK